MDKYHLGMPGVLPDTKCYAAFHQVAREATHYIPSICHPKLRKRWERRKPSEQRNVRQDG